MRNGRRKRKGRDHVLNPEVEGLTADGQDQEAGRDQEVEEGPIAEAGVLMTGNHLGGDRPRRIIGMGIVGRI